MQGPGPCCIQSVPTGRRRAFIEEYGWREELAELDFLRTCQHVQRQRPDAGALHRALLYHGATRIRGEANMLEFVVGIVLFFGIHSIAIIAPEWRNDMVRRMGALPWKSLYGLLSIVGIVLLVKGYGDLRWASSVLYTPPGWMRHVGMLLLVPVFPLLLATYLPGRIHAGVKHPMLLAVKIWALAHLLMNGRAVDLALFGAFLVWAVADRIAVKRRSSRPASTPTLPVAAYNDAVAIVAGLAIYVAFVLWLHTWLIGVPVVA